MKIALMWQGSREVRDTGQLEGHRLGPTAEAFQAEGFTVEPCVYNDQFADEVRAQLRNVDAVQVWVNPIGEDGSTREQLDLLLRDVADSGVLVRTHPETIQKIGTKDVLFKTRGMSWGSDVRRYASWEEMRAELPNSLADGTRVIKQARGHSGQGIWKVTPTGDPSSVLVRQAIRGSEDTAQTLDEFVRDCGVYFQTGPVYDQAYNHRIGEGTIRCYLVLDRVEGFGRQEANALVPGAEAGPRLYYAPDDPELQELKRQTETEWVPELMSLAGMSHNDLPMLWDIDLMFADGGYMLCEVNVSSVYPYPPSAMQPLARTFKAALVGR